MSGCGFEKWCATRGSSGGVRPRGAERQKRISVTLMPTFPNQVAIITMNRPPRKKARPSHKYRSKGPANGSGGAALAATIAAIPKCKAEEERNKGPRNHARVPYHPQGWR